MWPPAILPAGFPPLRAGRIAGATQNPLFGVHWCIDTHIKILAALYIISGAILVVLGLFLFGVIGGAGLISGDRQAMFVTGIVGTALASFFIILSIPTIIAGIGLLKRREWARILTIIIGILHLFGFPIGTAIGVYTLYVLLNDQTKPLFT